VNVDYEKLADDVESGAFRNELRDELLVGFRQIQLAGERLPTASHYASQIATIVGNGAPEPFAPEFAFNVYQEILAAVESARESVLGEEAKPS
jgi:hypothetical protein